MTDIDEHFYEQLREEVAIFERKIRKITGQDKLTLRDIVESDI